MATNTSKKRKQQRRQAIIRIFIMAAILVCINMLASYYHSSIDLTSEKRFTLSKPTKKLLSGMKDVAVVNVYLKGSFPAVFQQLQEAVREQLQYFKEYAGTHLVYHFIDPFEGKSDEEAKNLQQEFAKKGIIGFNVESRGNDEYSQKIVYPYAVVQYEGKEKVVQLLESHIGMDNSEELNNSESLLEYNLASAIRDLSLPERPAVAYLVGNGEPVRSPNKYELYRTVAQNYRFDTVDIANYYIPNYYRAIIICNPTLPFSDKDKFKIDQYVMNGGHVLWAINNLYTPMDSLLHSPEFITMDYGLNLDDILFKYGVRVNSDLVEDYECARIPFVISGSGADAQTEMRKWIYFPILYPISHHPIVNNMGPILSEFPNSIDTINNHEIKKTILLQSSKYSRNAPSPERVSLGIMRYPLTPDLFTRPNKPIAVLLEGRFRSVFHNRLSQSVKAMLAGPVIRKPFKEQCDSNNSMIVVSDGNIFSNEYSQTSGPLEMGYWKFDNQLFSNKTFLLNCLEYMTDPTGLIAARSKTVTLRLLDADRVSKEKSKWQFINIAIPIIVVLIFASCYFFFRKRKYESVA